MGTEYFGQMQGVSAYTFIDERSFLWHSLVFSAAERESTYVIDGLMHSDVVRSDIRSTDEHGFMEAVFRITHLPGLLRAEILGPEEAQALPVPERRGRRG